jgi:hypothetical protein
MCWLPWDRRSEYPGPDATGLHWHPLVMQDAIRASACGRRSRLAPVSRITPRTARLCAEAAADSWPSGPEPRAAGDHEGHRVDVSGIADHEFADAGIGQARLDVRAEHTSVEAQNTGRFNRGDGATPNMACHAAGAAEPSAGIELHAGGQLSFDFVERPDPARSA